MTLTLDQRFRSRFETLLQEGEKILREYGWPSAENYHHPEQVAYIRFRTEALNLIRRACGKDSDHYLELKKISERSETALNSYYYRDCFGVLQAAHCDYESGLLFDVRSLVAAEVFSDFLEQAEHLLANGFHVPAASLAGAIQRMVCGSWQIATQSKFSNAGRLTA